MFSLKLIIFFFLSYLSISICLFFLSFPVCITFDSFSLSLPFSIFLSLSLSFSSPLSSSLCLSLSLSYLLSIQVCFVQAMAAIRVLRSAATLVSLYFWYAKFHSASPPSAMAVQYTADFRSGSTLKTQKCRVKESRLWTKHYENCINKNENNQQHRISFWLDFHSICLSTHTFQISLYHELEVNFLNSLYLSDPYFFSGIKSHPSQFSSYLSFVAEVFNPVLVHSDLPLISLYFSLSIYCFNFMGLSISPGTCTF